MSLYEVMVFVALAGVAGFAYYLYRSDTRAKPPGAHARTDDTATGGLMFGRDRSGGKKSDRQDTP